MNSALKIILFLLLLISTSGNVASQVRVPLPFSGSEPRGLPELTVCSQNLENYGLLKDFLPRNRGTSAQGYYKKQDALATRFASQGCDVIMVQELLGKDEEIASQALQNLADQIRQKTNRFFQVVVGPTNDPFSRLGYMVALDRAEVLNKVSYYKVELPKLTEEEKPRLFSRGPLELQIQVKGLENSLPKTVTLINFHFKSKSGSSKDPSRTGWETYRMQMAEALRRIIESRHAAALKSGDTLLVVAGDRNSHWDSASAEILEGRVRLRNFQGEGQCRLSSRGIPLCAPGIASQQVLFSFLINDPETKQLPGTHRYKKVYSWLDEILAPADTLKFARATFDSEGNYDTGVVYEHGFASDHAMTYVRFNW